MKGIFSSALSGISKKLPQWMQPTAATNAVRPPPPSSSVNLSPPITKLSIPQLNELSSKQSSELDVKQLEELASVYYKGIEGYVTKDVQKAVDFWSAAGKLGSVDSIYYKALCYRSGEGVPKNVSMAYKDLRDLAETFNHSRAHYTLGVMHLKGEGVEVDEKLSFEYFKRAAIGGVLPAYHNMGNAYADGKGVDKDEVEALRCYDAAAKSGDPAAKFTLGTWYYKGRAGLLADPKKSFELQLEAAKLGHPIATYNVGTAYLHGDGVGKNEQLAAIWLERAVHFNIPAAIINLGNMYRYGVGVERDFEKSAQIFSKLKDDNVKREVLDELKSEMAQVPV